MSNSLVERNLVRDMCEARNRSLDMMKSAIGKLEVGFSEAYQAKNLMYGANKGSYYRGDDRTKREAFEILFKTFDKEKSLNVFREHLDSTMWTCLMERAGLERIMDVEEKERLENSLIEDVPEFVESNVYATIERIMCDANLIFLRGIANSFSKLDKRFKSHDVFSIKNRVIINNCFCNYGSWNYYKHTGETLRDIERVFAVLNGDVPDFESIVETIDKKRKEWSYSTKPELIETKYFRIRIYQNGNMHIWFNDKKLVEKVNRKLSEYYGDVLPDAVEKDDTNVTTTTTEVSKDLQFYATPPATVEKFFSRVKNHYDLKNKKILEPSAGEGALAIHAAKFGAKVTAVEIHSERAKKIKHPNVNVLNANFLGLTSRPDYDMILMNPPFYGTHWIDHVIHAFSFLNSGGGLFAILPVTAEIGETKRHIEFRKWAKKHNSTFYNLPPESFKESGTNVNTVVLSLMKR